MNKSDDLTLRLMSALDKQSEHLVSLADDALSKRMMEKLTGMRLSQFSNLLGVALETDSPKVIQNWLLYTMGRQERGTRPWSDSGLGIKVVEDIDDLNNTAKNITNQVYKRDPKEDEVQEAHIILTRRYIGYLRRWFVARGGQ